jgi:lipopolysaccharide heptosyltransferase I
MSKALQNILIIKPSSLGDIVLALPGLSALRRSFPDAKISWFVRTEFAPFIENHPHVTELILFDRKLLGKAWYSPRAFVQLVSLVRRLRRCKYDAVIDLQGLFRTASLGWLSGCRRRYGMANARECGHIFYTDKISQDSDCVHLVDYYLKIIAAAGAGDVKVEFVVAQDRAAEESVKKLLTGFGVADKKYVVFVPSSAQKNKCWPAERFAALAEKINERFGMSIIATGSESEKSVVEYLVNKSNVGVLNFAGLTNIKELTALLKGASLVVSNDTGPGHIAAAFSLPLVLIFGYSNPARVAPYGRSGCVAAVDPDARGVKADNFDPRFDVKNISVDQVFKKICNQLE